MPRVRSEHRGGRRAAAAAVVALLLALMGSGSAEAADLRVVAQTVDAGSRATVVVQAPTPPQASPAVPVTFSVLRAGHPLPPSDLVVNANLSVGIVIDPVTAAGQVQGDDLQEKLSGAAQLIMRLPQGSSGTLVSATNNAPQVLAPLSADPSSVVAGLARVRATSVAPVADMLALAANQLAGAPAGPHVIIMLTSRPVPSYEYLADETSLLAGAGTILDVVQYAGLDLGWELAAAKTGGETRLSDGAAGAATYDRVAQSLSGLHQLRFPFAHPRSDLVQLRVLIGGETMSTTLSLSAPAERRATLILGLKPAEAVLLLAAVVAVGIAYGYRHRRPPTRGARPRPAPRATP